MNKLKKEWAQLVPFEKVFYVLGLTLALAVIVMGILAVLQNLYLIFVKVQLLPLCLILLGLENLSRPKTRAVLLMTPDSFISFQRSLPSRLRSPTPAKTE